MHGTVTNICDVVIARFIKHSHSTWKDPLKVEQNGHAILVFLFQLMLTENNFLIVVRCQNTESQHSFNLEFIFRTDAHNYCGLWLWYILNTPEKYFYDCKLSHQCIQRRWNSLVKRSRSINSYNSGHEYLAIESDSRQMVLVPDENLWCTRHGHEQRVTEKRDSSSCF